MITVTQFLRELCYCASKGWSISHLMISRFSTRPGSHICMARDGEGSGGADGANRHGARVLVLDDDPAVGRTVCFILENSGMECTHVSRDSEFFELLDNWQPTYILLDLMMPGMDGVEVMSRLAEKGCDAFLILMSGVGSQVLDAARRTAGATGLNIAGVVSKPFTAGSLKRALEQCGHQEKAEARAETVRLSGLSVSDDDLSRAIRAREFTLVYQPKVRCADEGLVGFEALLRWHHPERGDIRPDHFIGLAEVSGHIVPITRLAFEQAIQWLASCRSTDMLLSLNVSARCLEDADFTDHLIALCGHFGVDPARLVLELTETSATEDPVAALSMLTRLRLKGAQLSIDDFGTGYSSMQQLAELPFSEIKVDKSFVRKAASSERSRSIIKSTVDLGRQLGMSVTAEGVEDEATLRYLREIGCDHAQGYLIARPMSADAARTWRSRTATSMP